MAPSSPYSSREYDWIRIGNDELKRGKADEALKYYERAAEGTDDPGLTAFNSAAAYYQLGDFREAERRYRMALNDEQIPEDRRLKALYNLGNCLVKQAGERDQALLRDAIRAYELCLDGGPDEKLRTQASLNLELAKMLWLKARQTSSEKPTPNSEQSDEHRPPEPKKKEEKKDKADDPGPEKKPAAGKKLTPTENPDGKSPDSKDVPKGKPTNAKPERSRVPVIPDTDELMPMSPQDAKLLLEAAEQRLRKMREEHRKGLATPEVPSGRDW